MTQLSQTGLCILFVYALAVGAFLGAVYDVFRILRVAFPYVNGNGVKKVYAALMLGIIFLEDMLYALIAAVTVNLFLFNVNDGQVRWFALLGAAMGFALWYVTVGRLIMRCARTIVAAVRRMLYFLYRILLLPVVRLLRFLSERLAWVLRKGYVRLSCARWERHFLRQAQRGFPRI